MIVRKTEYKKWNLIIEADERIYDELPVFEVEDEDTARTIEIDPEDILQYIEDNLNIIIIKKGIDVNV